MPLRILFIALISAHLAMAAVSVRSAHFQVIADTEATFAVQAASHLESTRDRLSGLGFFVPRREQPITVFLFANSTDFERYQASSRGRAFAATGTDRLLIALDASAPGNPWIALAHEYAHLVTDDGSLPPWFREGIAEFLALQLPYGTPPITASAEIAALLGEPWLPPSDWLQDSDQAANIRHNLFYAQSWLAVSWLASTQQTPLRHLAPTQLKELIAEQGIEAVLLQLRAHAAHLSLEPEVTSPTPLIRSDFRVQPLSPEDWADWNTEFLRCLRGNTAAAHQLIYRATASTASPLIHAGLAALAIDRGQFKSAEQHLEIAVTDAGATALTHHRYALVLLRPTAQATEPRAVLAAEHAQTALTRVPGYPEFLRTLAHAYVVAGQWDEAVGAIQQLRSTPGWLQVAAEDFRELERSRWQRMRAVSPPTIRPSATDYDVSFAHAPIAPLRTRHDYPWPPPDTQIMAGRIAGVTCSTTQKLIVMESPLFEIQFVEPANQPAKLHHPPLNWKTIPCGTSGWLVNIAYVPYRGRGPLKGEARAILF